MNLIPDYARGIYSTGAIAAAIGCPRQQVTDLIRRSGLSETGDGRSVDFVSVALIRQVFAWTSPNDRAGFGMGLRDAGSLANAVRFHFGEAVWFCKTLPDLIEAAPAVWAWRDPATAHGWGADFHPTYESFVQAMAGNPRWPSADRRMRFDGILIDMAWPLRWAAESVAPHSRVPG